MRCHICDKFIPAPTFNHDIGTYDPCSSCMDKISEAVAQYDEEDEEEMEDWEKI